MGAHHRSIFNVLFRSANMNDVPAKCIFVDPSARQLEEWRVRSVDSRSVGYMISVWPESDEVSIAYISFSCLGAFWRFNSLDGLGSSDCGMVVACRLLSVGVWVDYVSEQLVLDLTR